MQISNISGSFLRFKGSVRSDELFRDPEISMEIESNSIETLSAKLNSELLSDPFLAAERRPYIKFHSVAGCRQSAGKIWELTGQLTVRDTCRDITLVINYSGTNEDGKGRTALFHLFGDISRSDFGLICLTDENDVSDRVQVNAEILMVRKV
jgi:polyisoprenoid-binding protein YceI